MQNNKQAMLLSINQKSNQILYSFTLAYLVSFQAFLNCFNAILNFLGFRITLDTVVIYAVLWVSVLFSIFKIISTEKAKKDVFLITALFILAYISTMVIFPDNARYMFTRLIDYSANPIYVIFVYSFSGFIIVRYLHNYELFKNMLCVFSYIVVIISVFVYFFARDSFAGQYMTLSYNMLLQIIFLTLNKPKKYLWLHYFTLIFGIFIIIFGSARGALLGYLIGIISPFVVSTTYNTKSILKFILIITASALIIMFYNEFLYYCQRFLYMIGVESRTFSYLITPTDDFSSGRLSIYSTLAENFNLFGHGFFGDAVILSGGYTHNLFIEWLVDFGLSGGSILIILFLILLFNSLRSKNKHIQKHILLFIPNGLVALMLSGSYLHFSPAFYILSGLLISDITLKAPSSNANNKYLLKRSTSIK